MKRKRNPGATAFVPNLEVIFFAPARPKKEDPADGTIGRVVGVDEDKAVFVEWDDGTRSEVAQKFLALTGKAYRNPPVEIMRFTALDPVAKDDLRFAVGQTYAKKLEHMLVQITDVRVSKFKQKPRTWVDPDRIVAYKRLHTEPPPIIVSGSYIIEGNHRLIVAKKQGLKTIRVIDILQFDL